MSDDRTARIVGALEAMAGDQREQALLLAGLSHEERADLNRFLGAKAAAALERAEAHQREAEGAEWAADIASNQERLFEFLSDGWQDLCELSQVTQPAGLLGWLENATRRDPRALIGAVFAAVVAEDIWRQRPTSPAVAELRHAWDARLRKARRDTDGEQEA